MPPSTIVRPSTSAPLPVKTGGRPSGDVWARLRICESGGNYGANTGNGFFGAYQFSKTTWLSVGRTGMPHLASPAEQDAAARDLQARSGWGQWPACSRRLGLR
ncbi:MAG TPA: transglycosylase family protein [Acidimicrobiales bacterium]|nr:transglycosylase family protein [Acidimicrobiales bacterium]